MAGFALEPAAIAKYVQDKLTDITAHFDATVAIIYQTLRGERDQAVKGLKDLIDGLGQNLFRIDAEREKTHLKVLEIEARVAAMESGSGPSTSTSRKDNVLGKREVKDVPTFGSKTGPLFVDWAFDVQMALEQVCPEANLVIKWVEQQDSYEDISNLAMNQWVLREGLNSTDVVWATKQLYYLLVRKTDGVPRDLIQGEKDTDDARGARAWKRVHTFAAGLTQNRRLEILDRVSHPKRTNNYEELAAAVATWERDVRELSKFQNSALSDDQKISYLQGLVPTELENYMIHMQSTGTNTFSSFMQYVESQIAARRSGKSFGTRHAPKQNKDKDAMDVGSMEQSLGTYFNSASADEESGEHQCGEDAVGLHVMGGKGKGGWPINGNCDNCGQFGHAWRHCPKMDEAAKAAFAQKKGQVYKGNQKGFQQKGVVGGKSGSMKGNFGHPGYGKAGKGNGKEGGSSKGWNSWAPTPYGKGWSRKGGLNECGVSEEDVWDMGPWESQGIHALTIGCGPPVCRSSPTPVVQESLQNVEMKPVPEQTWEPVATKNSFGALPVTDEELDDYGVGQVEDHFPTLCSTARSKETAVRTVARKSRFRSTSRQALQDFLKMDRGGDEGVEHSPGGLFDRLLLEETAEAKLEDGDTPEGARANPHALHFLGPLEPADTSLNQVQASPGYHWVPIKSIVDSGAVHSVAPLGTAKRVPVAESHGSTNGLQYHTADGTRIPNLGQKKLSVVTEGGAQMHQTFQIAEVTRPLSSVGEIANKGNLVVFGRRGGYIWNPKTGTSLPFDREQGVYLLKTWIQEPNDETNPAGNSHFQRQG